MQLLVLYYMIAFQNLTNMKKLKLIIFFIITVLSANAQDKPSEEETVQLIQSILNDNTIYTKSGCELSPKTFSIKGMEIRTIEEREDYTYYAYYEKIHWERLDFYEEPKITTCAGLSTVKFYVPWFNCYYKYGRSGKFKQGQNDNSFEFYAATDKIQNLIDALLRLKEIYTEMDSQK